MDKRLRTATIYYLCSMQILAKKIAQLTGHRAAVFAVEAGPEPHTILSGAGDGWIVEWSLDDPENGKLIAKVDTNIFSLKYIPSTGTLVVGDMHGGVHWVKPGQPEATKDIAHHKNGVFAILELGDFVFTLGGEGKITRWSKKEERSLETLELSHQSLRNIAWSRSRKELAIGASDENIYILDTDTLEIKQTLSNAHGKSVFTVHYSPDDRYLFSGGRDAHFRVWDCQKNYAPIFSEAAHWFTINAIAFDPRGDFFATASRDKTIRIWDSKDFSLKKSLDLKKYGGHINSVNDLYWSPYRNELISASDDRSLIIWEIEKTKTI